MSKQATADNGTPKQKEYQGAFLSRLDDEEKEIEELEAERSGKNADQSESENEGDEVKDENKEPEPESAEDKNWKKRYGDLRKHLQKKEDEYKKALEESNKRIEKLEQSLKESPELPKTRAEVEQFKEDHEDVYNIMKAIAKEEFESDREEINQRLEQLQQTEEEKKAEEAETKLNQHVQDNWSLSLGELQADEEFHAWIKEEDEKDGESWRSEAIYDGNNWRKAARVIDLYFLDNGTAQQKKKARRKKEETESASAVETKGSKSEPKTSAKTLKESEVDRWTAQEFEEREGEIRQHIANGTFVYDLSGGAR